MNSTVKDVMSTHVIAVRQGAPYKDMAAMLHEQRVSAFPGDHPGRPRHHRRHQAHGGRGRRTRPAQLPAGLAVPPEDIRLMVPGLEGLR